MTRRTPETSREALAPVALDRLVEAAKAMGHPSRLRVLAMLRGGPLCVCQITSVLRAAASTVSQHLSDLRRAGLVAEQKRGKWVHYRLTEDAALSGLVQEALRLATGDERLRADAEMIEAVRAVPVDVLCRSGLDLDAVGVKPVPALLRARRGGMRPPGASTSRRVRNARREA